MRHRHPPWRRPAPTYERGAGPPYGLAGAAIGIFGLWCTVIAFIGGTLPLLDVHLNGGLLPGLIFLFIGEPLVTTLAYWAVMIVLLPLAALTARSSRSA
jgi:hypothetical protein